MRSIQVLIVVLLLSVQGVLASSSGIIRRATLTSDGCGSNSCHGAAITERTLVTVPQAVGGKLMVVPGGELELTLRVENPVRTAVGCNIAVKTVLNGNTNAGTFTAGTGLRVSFGELTQSSPQSFTDGVVELSFKWKAPDVEGTYYLHAIANAVNRNGSNDPQDEWNWMEPVEIIVSPSSSIDDDQKVHTKARLTPVPAHDGVTVQASLTPGETYDVIISDASGNVLARDRVIPNTDTFLYVWNGRTDSGIGVPSGTYMVSILGRREFVTAKALIIR